MRIIIEHGHVVGINGIIYKNVYIDNGKFCPPFPRDKVEKIIDANGMFVLPGIIDCSDHIDEMRDGICTCDDFRSASMASVMGGTTTILTNVVQEKGKMPLECLKRKKKAADKDIITDYSFHFQFTDINEKTLSQLPAIFEMGVTSIKLFLSGGKSGYRVRDAHLLRFMELAGEMGFLITVHAENDDIIDYEEKRMLSQGKNAVRFFAESRPAFSEVEAVRKAISYCEEAGKKVYLSHLSSAKSVAAAKKHPDCAIPETCIHYLTFDSGRYHDIDGYKYVAAPPLRSCADTDALWNGIADGTIKVVSTDHCPYSSAQKNTENVTDIPLGVPGASHLLPVMYSLGVAQNRISMERLVEVLCDNPARIFGLDKKGRIQDGYDADFVIFDPNTVDKVSNDKIPTKCDYSLYEGMSFVGKIVATGIRGEIVYENGNFIAPSARGRFIPRMLDNVK